MLVERAFAIGAGVLAALGAALIWVSFADGFAAIVWSFPVAGGLTLVFSAMFAYVARQARNDRLELVKPP